MMTEQEMQIAVALHAYLRDEAWSGRWDPKAGDTVAEIVPELVRVLLPWVLDQVNKAGDDAYLMAAEHATEMQEALYESIDELTLRVKALTPKTS